MNKKYAHPLFLEIQEILKEHLNELKARKRMASLRNRTLSLKEARIDVAKRKNPEVATSIDYFKDVNQDYIFWIAKELKSSPEIYNNDEDSLSNLKNIINKFDSLVRANHDINKNIDSYDGADVLARAVNTVPLTKSAQKREAKGTSNLIYQDGEENKRRFTIRQPLDKEASCHLGKSTNWCISATKSENFFDSYAIGEGVVFYFVTDNKATDPEMKLVAFKVYPTGRTEIFDSSDNKLPKSRILAAYPPRIIEVLNSVTNNFFKSAAEQHEQSLALFKTKMAEIPGMTVPEFRLFLRELNEESGDSVVQEFDPEDDGQQESEELNTLNHIQKLELLIKSVPLDKLPLLYYPTGMRNGTNLKGFRLFDAFLERLNNSHLSIDQLMPLIKTSWNHYPQTPDEWYYSDPYLEYLTDLTKHENLSAQDAKKILDFKPAGFDYPPYRNVIRSGMVWMLAPTIGIEAQEGNDNFTLFRNWMLSAQVRAEIQQVADLVKQGKIKEIRDWFYKWSDTSSIDWPAVKQIVDLVNNGTLTPEFAKQTDPTES